MRAAERGFGKSLRSSEDLEKQFLDVVAKTRSIRDDLKPLSDAGDQLANSIPNCDNIEYCHAALTGLSLLDDLDHFDERRFQGLLDGAQAAAQSLPQLEAQISALGGFLQEMRQALEPVRGTLDYLLPQISEITQFSRQIADSLGGGDPSGFFFLPSQAFQSPLFQSALSVFFSPDGKVTRMLVMGDANSFSQESMDCSAKIIPAATAALKGTSLGGSRVSLGGAGGTLLNIAAFAEEDFVTSAVAAFAFVFCVVLILLRSFVAAVAVVGTVALSYLSAWGLSVGVWQHLIGVPLHWSVAPCSFIFLVAVGADYNLLLVARFREELHAGLKTGVVRAMAGTGSVVTTAGLVFGFTMLAMIAGDSNTLAQIGTTVGVGLLIDTLVVRSLVIPAVATLLGRWFWWPLPVRNRPMPQRGLS